MKKGDQFLLIVSLTVSLLLGEVACRLFLPRPGFVPLGSDDIPGLWTQHPVRGYVYTANFEGAMARDDFSVTIKTNEDGLRIGKGTKCAATHLLTLRALKADIYFLRCISRGSARLISGSTNGLRWARIHGSKDTR